MDKPIRILHYVTLMNVGGLETMLMNIYRNIDRNKVQFDFLLHRNKKSFYDNEIEALGGRIYNGISFNPFHHKSYVKSINDFLDTHPEYKVFHAHTAFGMFGLRCAKEHNIPMRIQHCHNTPTIDAKTLFRLYCRMNLNKQATHLFACSNAAGNYMFGKRSKFTVINNAIDIQKFIFNKDARYICRKELNCTDNFVIGHIGRFMYQKNHNFLIDVFAELYKLNPKAKLLLVGDGPLRLKIEKKVQKLRLSNVVIFVGVRADIPKLMQAIDVFVMPSHFEGLPVVGIEAQASDLPCIISDAVTPEMCVLTDRVHFVSLKKSIKEWAEIILQQIGLERKDRSTQIHESGFDIKIEAEKLEKFYLSIK